MSALALVIIGLVGLIIGGELVVRGAVSAANRFGVSPMVIGLTLVGFGTSTPELVTSLQAALSGSPGIAIGNVVGSNISNVLLILGIAAILAPVAVNPAAFKRDASVMVLATVLGLVVVLIGDVDRLSGVLFVTTLIGYLSFTLISERRAKATPAAAVYEAEAEAVHGPDYNLRISLIIDHCRSWPCLYHLGRTVSGVRSRVTGASGRRF